MPANDFLVFGGGSSPNVIDQATYAALSARLSGFQSGTAQSNQVNKVLRQSSIMAAVLAQFTANFSGQNSVDDGSTATLLANLQAAINAAGITAPQFDSSTKLATTAFVQQANGNFQARQVVYGTTSITNAASGSWIECAGAGGYTITLPNPSATNLSLTFSNVSNGIVTLATPSASIYDQGNPASTFQIDQNAVVKLASDGNWVVIDCYSPTPRATSPALGDNSKRLATTAWYWNQISAGVSSAGKVNGVNSPNLLFNGSAEFGVAGGWGGGFVNAYNGGSGDGTYFSNPAAINSNSYVGSSPIAIAAGIQLTLSGEIYSAGVTSGIAWFRLVYLNSSSGVISTSANITATNGAGWKFASSSFTTPANTAFVYVQLGVEAPGPNVSSGGVAWRRLKLERGAAPSLYSQEASVAALAVTHGMAQFTSSGTFTVPANVTNLKVTLIGGGASGGGCFSASTYANAAGGGGGAGGIAIGWFAVTPGQSIPYTIGAGGPPVSNGSSFGGTSSISLFGLTANGGNPSTLSNSSSPGGSGGTASGGQINIQGSSGTDGQNVSAFVFGGKGGDGMFGGGGRAGSGAGTGGNAPGAGGGGAYDLGASNTAKSGGAGYSGAVIFEW
ncbi:hypothetical protein B7L17_011630 [Burkholderia cenocepacia]|uniref:glycine-rich domain-containing protein n=1 Tax=Burkholderia cenocepacia TaxID=95486 RepID=UPI002237168F|nr:hypothetical protein [Burkholderia cenocepacia]MCW5118609.1 hypothetical protein [Burkholderia cenocepacia]MCW5130920.1 hypothetical protein [Burkholderia cenocepacia]MCW5174048.1 hypothetical protein [Burkholderia cenocepacia]